MRFEGIGFFQYLWTAYQTMGHYYIKRFGKVAGPFEKEDLQKQWLFPNTIVSSDPTGDWHTLSDVDELRDLVPAARRRQLIFFSSSAVAISAIIIIVMLLNTSTQPLVIEKNISTKAGDALTVTPFQGKHSADTYRTDTGSRTLPDPEVLKPLPVRILKTKNDIRKTVYLSVLENYKRDLRNHFQEYLRTNNSTFHINEMGMVTDIQLVISNSTIYYFDEVEVTVQFFDENKTMIDAVPYVINCIKPLSKKDMTLPDRPNARSVNFILASAKSRSLSFFYDNEKSCKGKDPYFFRW